MDAIRPPAVPEGWSAARWQRFEEQTRRRVLAASSSGAAWETLTRGARIVMRTYTTGFFLVSRFLPPVKRRQVEAVYAAVRYPDEVVDTFPLDPPERLRRLDEWSDAYERGRLLPDLRAMLAAGVPVFLAGFLDVLRRTGIPPDYYRAFLNAMRRDVAPRPFATLPDLVENYIYGSAIVVGYFLAHIYGASGPVRFEDTRAASRDLGIALQLTNFLRDVADDARRGRLYLPLDWLREEGLDAPDPADPAQREAFGRVIRRAARHAADLYRQAESRLDAFHPDSRIAIQACIRVYARLNERILKSPRGLIHRESVPFPEKWHVLPPSKYWRIPLAYWFP